MFSDDTPDSDLITSAALRVLDPSSTTSSPILNAQDGHSNTNGRAKERFVLIDMDATGTKVLSAQSMSPDWAVTSTELSSAPTWDKDGDKNGEEMQEGEEGETKGLMLRIEGMEVLGESVVVERSRKGKEEEEGKRLEELVEVYGRKMGELKRVVDAGAGAGVVGGLDIEETRRT